MKTRFIFLLLLSIGLISCDNTLNIDLEGDEHRIALNGFFSPEDSMGVFLLEAISVLDPRWSAEIDGADINLYDSDGEHITSFVQHEAQSFLYESNFYPQPGETYRIEASFGDLPPIFAEDTIPFDSAIVSSTELTRLSLVPESLSFSTKHSLSFVLDDPPGEDFYEIVVHERIRGLLPNGEPGPQFIFIELESNDPIFGLYSQDFSLIFDDRLFDGSKKEIQVQFALEGYECVEEIEECFDYQVRLEVRKTSEAYYRYNTTYDLYRSLDGNQLSEPVQVYNNIENGFGIFAGYQSSYFQLTLPD